MFSGSEVLSSDMLHTHFPLLFASSNADFPLEFIYHLFGKFLVGHGTFAQFSCRGPDAQNVCVQRKHRRLLKATRALKIVVSLQSPFWVEFCFYFHLPHEHLALLAG